MKTIIRRSIPTSEFLFLELFSIIIFISSIDLINSITFNNGNFLQEDNSTITFHDLSESIQIQNNNKKLTFGSLIKHKIPIIGILAYYEKSLSKDNTTLVAKIENSYVYWLQSGGSAVIPILPWMKETKINSILNTCNGILFQHTDYIDSDVLKVKYENSAKIIYNKIKYLNKHNVSMPLFGIGNGANLIQILEANTNEIISKYSDSHSYASLIPVEFVFSDLRRIRMIHYFDGRDVVNIQKMNITGQYGKSGVSAESYSKFESLKLMFKIVAQGKFFEKQIRENKKFISMFEAYRYPIYGISFDPAKYIYNRYDDKGILDYSNEAVTISQKILNFFIKESYNSLLKKVSEENFLKNNFKLFSKQFKGIDIQQELPIKETNTLKNTKFHLYFYKYTFDNTPHNDETTQNQQDIHNINNTHLNKPLNHFNHTFLNLNITNNNHTTSHNILKPTLNHNQTTATSKHHLKKKKNKKKKQKGAKNNTIAKVEKNNLINSFAERYKENKKEDQDYFIYWRYDNSKFY